MDDAAKKTHFENVQRDGYTIVENAIEPDLVETLTEALERLEHDRDAKPANNSFEGHHTVRIYNLLAYGAPFLGVPTHTNVLPVIDEVLDPGCLISSLSSIDIRGGESAQPIHADDQLIPLDKPHRPIVCNTMWALTDFTERNGATRIVPGSHAADASPEYGRHYDSIAAEMRKGSVLVWNGSLWHGGGANRTSERRVGIAMNYCAGFIRQQENQQLGIPAEIARNFDERLKRLVGYGIYRGLIGHIDKTDPIARLGESGDARVVWDRG